MLIKDFDFKTNYDLSKLRAVEMIDNQLYSRFRLSKESRIEKAQLGCLGELAFEQFLLSEKYSYQSDRRNFKNRHSDEFDFLINGKKLDIKVAKKSTSNLPNDNWTYGYPAEQKPSSKDFIIIGWIDIAGQAVGFYGWTTGHIVCQSQIVTVNSFKGYKYLTPNHEFKWGLLNKNFTELFKAILT